MHTMTTLVVDDNESYRQGLVNFLKALDGIEIVGEASNGREAIDKTHILHPELVLMDISMPGMGGWRRPDLSRSNTATRRSSL